MLAPRFGQVVSNHAAVAVRHPSLVAEQLLVPVSAAFAGTGEATFAGTTAVDVVPHRGDEAAVEPLLTDAGHHGESAVVFGDMPNDLGLFAFLGWSCVVANAHPLVLQAADEIVPSSTVAERPSSGCALPESSHRTRSVRLGHRTSRQNSCSRRADRRDRRTNEGRFSAPLIGAPWSATHAWNEGVTGAP